VKILKMTSAFASWPATALEVTFAITGGVAAVLALYLLLVVVAALLGRQRISSAASSHAQSAIAVVIPAHDEERLVARTVASLRNQTYPRGLYEIVVVADNCTDETARVAEAAGAIVLVRNDPDSRGKGYALRWAFERVLGREDPPDALVVVDADSVADPAFLAILEARFQAGAEAVQGESLLVPDGSTSGALRAAAFLLINRARPLGRAVLGLPSGLCGNGMLFSRRVLQDHPWDAFTSTEDVEYAVKLRLDGIDPVFARGAIVSSPVAPTARAAEEQQLRWEGGQLHVARVYVPALLFRAVRERRARFLDVALELAVPPLGYLVAAAAVLTATGAVLVVTGLVDAWAVVPAAVGTVALPLYVMLGLWAAEAPASSYRALLGAPRLVLGKVAKAYRLRDFRPDSWLRTERRGD
jgi:cellulose synthase/poly-beta-1,6-N-acetylglucosamine synthase-like glycosyltransferase